MKLWADLEKKWGQKGSTGLSNFLQNPYFSINLDWVEIQSMPNTPAYLTTTLYEVPNCTIVYAVGRPCCAHNT